MAEQLPASRQKQRAIPSQAQDRIRQRLARSKLEQTFQVLKVRFNHRKIRYRGLEKYTVQLFSLFGLANLMLAKRYLQRAAG